MQGKLMVTGLENITGAEAVAFLDRDADSASGDFRLTAKLELAPSGKTGDYRFSLMTENGEYLIGALFYCQNKKVILSGLNGHSCTTVKSTPLTLAKPQGTLEINRKKEHFQVLFNGVSVFEASGDTAPAASFRLQVSDAPWTLVLSSITLAN